MDKIMKVAENLNVSLDYLIYGVNESAACSGVSTDRKREEDLIAMFRLLPEAHQAELFEYTYFKYKRLVEKNGESIYSAYSDTKDNRKSGHAQGDTQDATA